MAARMLRAHVRASATANCAVGGLNEFRILWVRDGGIVADRPIAGHTGQLKRAVDLEDADATPLERALHERARVQQVAHDGVGDVSDCADQRAGRNELSRR